MYKCELVVKYMLVLFVLFLGWTRLTDSKSLLSKHRLRICRESDCIGTTPCLHGETCQSYLRGEPCLSDTTDIELYMDMYYLKKIRLNTTCWTTKATYKIKIVGDSEGMTTEQYDNMTSNSLRRVDYVNGSWYALGEFRRTSNK